MYTNNPDVYYMMPVKDSRKKDCETARENWGSHIWSLICCPRHMVKWSYM